MKKKLVAMICAVVLAMALPMTAFAAGSSETKTVTAGSFSIAGVSTLFDGLTCTETSTVASNVPSGTTPAANLDMHYADGHSAIGGTLTVTVNVGSSNAGRTATVYVQHQGDNTGTETINAGTVSSTGTVSFQVSKLSIYSVVLGDKTNGSTDSSSTSPKTGVDFTGMMVVAGVAVLGAGAAFAVRRKLSE